MPQTVATCFNGVWHVLAGFEPFSASHGAASRPAPDRHDVLPAFGVGTLTKAYARDQQHPDSCNTCNNAHNY